MEWLGEVPKHWEVSLLKRRYQVTLGKMLKSNQTSPNETEEFYLRAANIHWRGVDTTDVKRMWFTPEEKNKLKLCKGDLLVSEGGDVGRSALWNDEIEGCYIQNSINRIRAREDADTRFLFYWMSFIKHADYIDMICNKATIAHFTVEKVEATPCVYPPLEEQKRIAAFLDKETKKIDALIDKQEQLIALLQEKRQAIISHAVTRGLNPNAKMKDSGIEWLGEVPKHWEAKRLKFCVQLTDQKIEANREKPLPYVGLENIQSWTGKLLPIDPNVVPTSVANRFGKGMTLFGKLRPYLAKACNPDFEGLCSTELLVFKSTGFDQRLLLYLLLTDGFIKAVDSSTYGAKMPRANWDFIGNCIVPVPPLEEQKQIAAFINRETTKIDTLIEKCETAIELLKERRTALISAAVTGKIDVRNVG